jgi:hypothetical protein
MNLDRRRVVAVAVVALVLLAGCAGAGNDGGEAASGEPRAQQSGGDAGGDGGNGGDTGLDFDQSEGEGGDAATSGASAAVQNRAIIKTGTVRVEVDNATETRARLGSRVAELGGYTAGSDVTRHQKNNETWQEGYVVVRVPSENFSAMIEAASADATVLSEQTETEDVTDQLVDLNARLENLRAERDQLRELYNRSNSTEDVLAVQERLSDVQGEIERLEARQRSLRDRVAFSTLRIEYQEPRPEFAQIEQTNFYEQSPLEALGNSIATLVRVARTLFLAGVIVLPWLAVAAVPVGLLTVIVRRFVWTE